MINKQNSVKEMAILGILLLLSLGTLSIANATTEYNPIDLIDFSTYLGGAGDEHMDVVYAFGSMVTDSEGNIIVVGRTTSTDFPLKNAYQDHLNGSSDSTISKFHPNGSLIFSTYFGGSEHELITGVVVDSENNIIVAGITGSSDLPVINAFQTDSASSTEGVTDCFIAKFSEDGQSLLFSTYFGGSDYDYIYAVAIDSDDRIVITGTTQSNDIPLLHPVQDSNGGSLDIFISFFEADGQSLLFSTYLGTAGIDHGRDLKFDSQGNIWLTGISANGDLATEGAYQEEYSGGICDAYLAKFDTSGTLVYFTFLGGAALEWGNALAIDNGDNIVITGFTTSDDFPTMNPYQDEPVDFADMFITKFAPDGESIVFSTYFGGSSVDHSNAITIDSNDNIIVTGQTNSLDFPTTLPYNTTEENHTNMTIVALDSEGSLLASLVFGGVDNDVGIEVVWYSNYTFVVLGYAESTNLPINQAYQENNGGEYDMFIMKLDLQDLLVTPTPTSTPTETEGFPLGLLEVSIVIGVVAVVVVLLIVRKRTS